ncbi:hypothetical protein A8E95_21730 [Burkholderia cenocepacia]|nr:hypothetical protein A8E96_29305 [Burkholderia cenocepacia]ONW30182.1 hypothetical protein A8E95_21730 [Burkholderia cenocepacia]
MSAIINELRWPAVRCRTGANLSYMTEVNRQIENATNPAAQTYTRKNFACLSRKWSQLFSESRAIGPILFEMVKMASCIASGLLRESRLAFPMTDTCARRRLPRGASRAPASRRPCLVARRLAAPETQGTKEERRAVVNARETIPYTASPHAFADCNCRRFAARSQTSDKGAAGRLGR